jgi:amino acid adenylation domain-containing protein
VVSELIERISGLTDEQRALLALRMMKKRAAQAREYQIPRRAKSEPCLLSFGQLRLWLLHQIDSASSAYNMPKAVAIEGSLDREALRHALTAVVARQNVLRTAFTMLNGNPVQTVVENARVEMPVIDLREFGDAAREAELKSVLRTHSQCPFDLAHDLLLRAVLVQLGEQNHVLLLVTHHIASDAWSRAILFREIAAFYRSYQNGEPHGLPELPIQYADYAHWQRQWLKDEELAFHLNYWKEQLGESSQVLELPTDRPRPAVQTTHGARRSLALPGSLMQSTSVLGQREEATLFMTLLAAFQVLLYRYTGHEDVAVGSPIAGRSRVETEGLIGLFVNTLVLRSNLSGNPTFREFLRRVRHVALGAFAHQDLPFEKLVEELRPERRLSHTPLFQVMFLLQTGPQHALDLPGLTTRVLDVDSGAAPFDLTLYVREDAGNWQASVVYNSDLFEADKMDRMLGHLQTLLTGIVANSDQRLSELLLLTEAERHQLLVQWNDTTVEYPRDKCVHQLFEEQVERTPSTVAVVFEGQELTYRELNERANQLAHYLRKLGVGPEVLVGLCLDRSLELAIGILGILKAGGAYLPLDANSPPQRLEFMLHDSAVAHLVTQRKLLHRLPVKVDRTVLLDPDEPVFTDLATGDLQSGVGPHHLAYIMYTSGSRGHPKGVQILHSAVVNLLTSMAMQPGLTPEDRLLSVTTPTFDISVLELLLPLTVGARVDVLRSDVVSDAAGLATCLSTGAATVMQATPATWQMLIHGGWQGRRNLKVLCGGEALSDTLAAELHRRCGELWNMYGPTETTIWSATRQVTDDIISGSIGRPIANTQVYVLDAQRNPVPIGVPGELYIGGVGLARGYLNRPELTAEKFVPNPFSDDPDSRLYRTGDLCRWRADGNLEFLGRTDDQVKLRGFRIELGEIEALLDQHPSVAHSVVVLREDRPGDKQLVAYCVSAGTAVLDVTDLTRHLHTRLPDYMVPSVFVPLKAFPLSPSGKINRRALPAPDNTRPELESESVAPRNPLEEQLATIWCDVLGIQSIGIHDNFFALGGHSLLAARVAARVAALEVELPLRKMFEAPTIAGLAIEINLLRAGEARSPTTPLVRFDRERTKRLPLSFAQQRLWFLEQIEGELTAYNMPFGWRLCGPLNTEALRRALETVVRRHEPLRTTFELVDGEPVQVIQTIERLELPLEDLRGLATNKQAAEIVMRSGAEAERPFDLTRDLMLRASLLHLGEDEHVLMLTMHHIASDGWSLRVLWRELEALYDANCRGTDPDLPDLAVQYADYALWLRNELQGQRLEWLVQYWREQLEGTSALELPTNRPRPPVSTYRGARHAFELHEELVDQLKSLSQREGVTLHMTLLAAFQTLLARYSGQEDISVGTSIAGRTHSELEGLIGFFVNTLVLRTDLSGDPTFRDLLGRVREVSLGAYDHQDLPFEKLVEELQPQRDLSRSPLVQVLFQLLNFSDKDLALLGLEMSRLPSSSERVRFDLEMYLWQQARNVRGVIIYSTDLFEAATIERMVGHFVTLLEGVVADADQRFSELPLLTKAEHRQLLVEWNNTAIDYPRDKCVHELFEQQVERIPDALAVIFEGQQLTYRELNERTNQLAHYLRSRGVGPETLVGLCLERSVELVVGILGILKAGGAYVPLSMDYPRPRLEFMLQDAAVDFLVTQHRLLDRLPASGRQVFCLDTEAGHLRQMPRSNPPGSFAAGNLAYVMFTSGSTGQPKGVAIRHTSIARLVFGTNYATFGPDRVFLQLAPVAFDASTFELWGALLHGAKLVIAPDGLPDFQQLEDLIQQNGVTTLWLTATLFNQLVDQRPEALAGVAEVLTGGETLSVLHIRRAQKALGACVQLINGYGPTESTTFATCYRIPPDIPPGTESIPIGRPIGNTQVYVLDEHRQPVPIGVPGELYLGGAGLARGYLNRQELTAEKFVANPFSDHPHSPLYRTGDRCRWRADGELEFLGRLDDQVKLRGFRIELGEIEAALHEHPAVAQSVVTLRDDLPGERRLVAYCVPAMNAILNISELRSHLISKLPDYMLPSAFVVLDALPLTPNGKVDRRVLPVPDHSRAELKSAYVAPQNPIEEQLADIWCELLGIQRVGVHDNFFELGGHSLLAVRMFARIEKSFGRKLPLAMLFQRGAIRHIARILSDPEPDTPIVSVVELQAKGNGRPLFLMPSIGGELLLSKRLLDELGNRFPVLGLQPALSRRHLEQFRDFRTTAGHFSSALREYQPHGPYALAGFSYGGFLAFEVACLLTEIGETVDVLAIIDTGPGRRRLGSQTGEPLIRLARILANLPLWVGEELRSFLPSRWISSARLKFNYMRRWLTSGGRIGVQLDDIFDVSRIPTQNRELMQTVFAAFRDYTPGRYRGKLTLFRAQTQPLLSGSSPDLGWSRFVGVLDVRHIKGNHETILRPPHVRELARQLGKLLASTEPLVSSAQP